MNPASRLVHAFLPRSILPLGGLPALTALCCLWSGHASAADGTLYVVSTAHLDTQWQWTIRDTITKFIPNTMHGQLALMDKYPGYVFSFEGAFRYELMKEYYHDDFAKVKDKVAKGQWAPTGASVDAGDVNIPSAESIIRHVLYGNGFFKKEFGKTTKDIFLPDCFGFPYSLPTIAAHCGLSGFSTQKLGWGCWLGIPFGVGMWQGPDGSAIVAALDPGSYSEGITVNLSTDSAKVKAVHNNPAHVAYAYFGVGDMGGAPSTHSLDMLTKSVNNTSGPIRVLSAPGGQLFRDLTDQQKASGC